MIVEVPSQTYWTLHEWPAQRHVLAWGTHQAAINAKDLDFNVVVLAAAGLQMPALRSSAALAVRRFPFEDDGALVASDVFKARLCREAEAVAMMFRSGEQTGRSVRVVVTCHLGYNRSALLAARILHELTGSPGYDIVRAVRSLRPDALHRDAFREWVDSWGDVT